MFTPEEKETLVNALISVKASIERSKAKSRNPKFAPLYDEDLRLIAALTMKVQSMEVVSERKVASR